MSCKCWFVKIVLAKIFIVCACSYTKVGYSGFMNAMIYRDRWMGEIHNEKNGYNDAPYIHFKIIDWIIRIYGK